MFSGLNDYARLTLPAALDEHAETIPHETWLSTVDGEALTFGEAAAQSRQACAYFRSLGIGAGDRVAIMLGNGLEFVRAWMGLGYLGATAVLLNTELRGAFLRHQLTNSAVDTIVVDAGFLEAVTAACDSAVALRRAVVVGEPASQSSALELIDWRAWANADSDGSAPPAPNDIACIMYTSGTSGPSKGVLMPHLHCALYGVGAIEAFEITAEDKYYIVLPLFHANGLLMQLGTSLLAGIPAVIRPRFSASCWLDDIREHGATVTNLLGALAAFVIGSGATADDRNHRLRAILNGPNIAEYEQVFRERFGIADVLSGFGMTEVNIPIWGRIGHSTPGAAGWTHEHRFEVIIANPETDAEVPRGELGEILVRPKIPWGFMAGYFAMPEKTVEAWRNLWFHTGDAGHMTDDGLVTFVDRIKDCIRRRGENISAAEVEAVVAGLPGVEEVAAFAVDSDIVGGEDEVMLALVAKDNAVLNLEQIAAAADAELPRYARPRYLEIVDDLPKTATGKVQRQVLRDRGSAMALDRGDPRGRKGAGT